MIGVDRGLCPHDHPCPLIGICPVGAIAQGSDGFPVIDHEVCIECGLCTKNCPKRAMKFIEAGKTV